MYKKKGKFCIHRLFIILSPTTRACPAGDSLESRVGVGEQLLEVGLEPLASLGGGLEGIGEAAVVVVAGSAGVAGAVALATGLDPDEGIEEAVAGVGGRARTEAGALFSVSKFCEGDKRDGALETHNGVAPVTPLRLAGGLLAVAASVGDEVSREAGVGEERAEGLDVVLLVVVGVALGVRRGGGDAPGVVVGNVGGQAADRSGLAGARVDAGKQIGGGLDVGGPAEPPGVASIEVHGNVGQVELLEGIHGQLLVGRGGAAALGDVHVGDQVGKGVGLNDQDGADIRVLDEERADGADVALVVGGTTAGDGELAVGGSSGTKTMSALREKGQSRRRRHVRAAACWRRGFH